MKKTALVLAILALAFGSAFATESRIDGLGLPIWAVMSDDALGKIYISQEAFYNNELLITHGNALNIEILDIMAAVMANGPINIPYTTTAKINASVFGGTLTVLAEGYKGPLQIAYAGPNGSSSIDIGTGDPASNNSITPNIACLPAYNFGLGYATDLGGLAVGLGLNLAMASDSDKSSQIAGGMGEDTFNVSNSSLDAGVELAASAKDLAGTGIGLDLGLKFNLPVVNNTGKQFDHVTGVTRYDESLKSVSGMGLEINGRVLAGPVILGAGYTMDTMKTEFADRTDSNLDSVWENNELAKNDVATSDLTVGLAANIEPTSKVRIVPGIAFTSSSMTMDMTNENLLTSTMTSDMNLKMGTVQVPLFVAAEGRVTDALTARVGISKLVYNGSSMEITEYGDGVKSEDSVLTRDISISGGISITVGDCTIDGVVTGGLRASGIQTVAGSSFPLNDIEFRVPGGLMTSVSAKYKF